MQYGRILDIDLKIPPRPPGYAFVEVRIFCYGHVFYKNTVGGLYSDFMIEALLLFWY